MFRQFRKFERDEFILCAVDTAAGGADYCAAQFLSKTHLDVPLVYHAKEVASSMTPRIFSALEHIFDVANVAPTVAFERNNGGVFELERLAGLNRSGKYNIFHMPAYGNIDPQQPKKIGWDTNSATRPKMQGDLKQAIDGQMIKVYDKLTIEEMFSFIVVQTTTTWRAQAEEGAHDDLIMALAIAWQMQQSETPLIETNKYMLPQFQQKGKWAIK
jgi:hypothetical protein